MDCIEKIGKQEGKCKSCDAYSLNSMWYKWYSLFDGRLLLDMICKKCAKRELGSKNKKEHERLL